VSTEGRRRTAGFTLLELIVVIAVIGILAAIALPALKNVPRRATESVLKNNLRTMRDVIDQYMGDKGNYPPSLEALVEEGYLRKVPNDPITKSNDTWLLVFEEPSDEESGGFSDDETAQPGIIDVHSGSDQLSLDGTPYSEW
jgi:general secretion pathway protein G